jgi:curved DNA-binding protein CbpA
MPRVPYDPAIDYYKLLGVTAAASPEEIQAAYRRLAKEFHPDLNAGSASAAARMARVNVAKSVLLDPDTRISYDRARRARQPRVAAAVVRPAAAATPPGYATPYQVSAQPRYRVTSRSAGRAAAAGAFDRQTGLLLIVALPLMAALVVYVFQALQLSAQPLRTPPPDVSLVPNNSRTTGRGAADAAFTMVHTQPASPELARRANNLILARSDSTPESELLRADGRRLVRAASAGDTEDWEATVADLCVLAGRC